MDVSSFDYELPTSLIAQAPAAGRGQSRLLHVADSLEDLQFSNFIDLLNPGDLLIMNNTKVIPARLFGVKSTGGKVEIMMERIVDDFHAIVQLKSSKSLKPGQEIFVADGICLRVKTKSAGFYELVSSGDTFEDLLEKFGNLPLPPYITRDPQQMDQARYQTVYARHPGAVAAPTAGLHFDDTMLKAISTKGIHIEELTLHVGAGTFQPVRVADVTAHTMHQEWFHVNAQTINRIKQVKQHGGRTVAVGTTTVRALESAYKYNKLTQQLKANTDIFIYPGFKFRVVDAMLTNFHLPKSTLLMLVCAFAGHETMMQAYRHAIKQKYRFFSYGDAMFISGKSC